MTTREAQAQARAEWRALRRQFVADGLAAARRLDAGDPATRELLGATTTSSFIDCPQCHGLVASDHRMTRLACPWCRVVICETAGSV